MPVSRLELCREPEGPLVEAAVNLAAVRHNVEVLTAAAAGAATMVIVKADGLRPRRGSGRPGGAGGRRHLARRVHARGGARAARCGDRGAGAVVVARARRGLCSGPCGRDRPVRRVARTPCRDHRGRTPVRAHRPRAPQGRHRAEPQRRRACGVAGPARRRGEGGRRRGGRGRGRVVAPGARGPAGAPDAGRAGRSPDRRLAGRTRPRPRADPPPRQLCGHPRPGRTCTSTWSDRASRCTGSIHWRDRSRRVLCGRR